MLDMGSRLFSCGPRCFVDTTRIPMLKNIITGRRGYTCTYKCKPMNVINPLLDSCSRNEVKFETTRSRYLLETCKTKPKVIIIGAGIAGLSAAHRLQTNGITDYLVLEAKDRIGGRIHTVEVGNSEFDLGSDYILGAGLKNSVYQLAAEEQIFTGPPMNPRRDYYYHTSDGRVVDPIVGMVACTIFQEIERCSRMVFQTTDEKSFGNLQTFISLRVLQMLRSFPKEFQYDALNVINGLANHLQYYTGASLSDINTKLYGSRDFLTGIKVRVPNGFKRVLSPLLKEIPLDNIIKKKPIQKIVSLTPGHAGKRLKVCCCDGESHFGDFVICTIPVAVLKLDGAEMFDPPLSKEKLEALASVKNGYNNKIALEYDYPFWPRGHGTFRLAWSEEEMRDQDDWVKGISMVEEAPGSHFILCCYIGGRGARMMEHCHLQNVAERMTYLLRNFMGDISVPFPSRVLRSCWTQDQFAGASTYYLSAESTLESFKEICAPVLTPDESIPSILFAGDGCKLEYLGTVHGARTSGIEAADKILQLKSQVEAAPASASG